MRIAIYQCEPRPAQVDRNLERLARIAKHASAEGVALLVCPEMYLTGYNIGVGAVRGWRNPAMARQGGWRVGMLIRYDVEFPESSRKLALCGTDLILAPTANMVPFDVVATTIVPAARSITGC